MDLPRRVFPPPLAPPPSPRQGRNRWWALVVASGLWACAPAADAPVVGRCEQTFSDRGDVRIFVVGHRFTIEDTYSYDAFEASYRRHVQQRIAPCLAVNRPNLLLFPEDAGLHAWFIGRRAMLARSARDSGSAFNALFAQYQRAAEAYRARFPGASLARSLTLAGADAAWRAMNRTFGGIADDYDVWVLTSANLPAVEHTHDPALVARFGDPDARDGAYVAAGPEVWNGALVYGPDGSLVDRVDKVYLTDSEEQTLDMTNAPLEQLRVMELPFGRLGVAISRDAFYAPFAQRLEDLGAELWVMQEASFGWTVEQVEGDWLPDLFLASGWANTQKYRGLRFNAEPVLAGNLFDLQFDGQTWIAGKADPTAPQRALVGGSPLPGFLAVGPWTFEDPGDADPGLTLEERRERLRVLGRELAPGSGAKHEGAYRDSLIAADLELFGMHRQPPVRKVTPSAGVPSVEVAPAADGHQLNPDVAYGAEGRVVAAWSDTRSGGPRVLFARSPDNGRTWLPARAVEASGTSAQLRPSIAVAGPAVAIAWQEGSGGHEQIRLATSENGGATFDFRWLEPTQASQWEPDVALAEDGALAVTWTDFRQGGLAPSVRITCAAKGAVPGPSRDVDGSTRSLPRAGASQLQPSVAVLRERVAVTWIDYRTRDWQVRAAVGRLGVEGCALGESAQLGLETARERLTSDPQAAFSAGGELVVVWDDASERRGHHDVRGSVLRPGASGWASLPLLGAGADDGQPISRFRPTPAPLSAGWRVAYQDLEPRKNGLSVATFVPGTAAPTRARFDDTGASANQLTRPRAAVRTDGRRGVVVFEDDREGWSRVRASALQP